MKVSFKRASQLAQRRGVMILPGLTVRADDIDVIGNWDKPDHFLLHLKSGQQYQIETDVVQALQMVLASLNGDVTDYRTFEPSRLGYRQKFYSGFLLLLDYNSTFLGVLAENIAMLKDHSSKKTNETSLITTSGNSFTFDARLEDIQEGYIDALNGKNTAFWPEEWPYEKPQLRSLIKPKAEIAKIKLV